MSGADAEVIASPAPVVPRAYWEARGRRFAHLGRGLRAVCSYGMPGYYNAYIHLAQGRALSRWLRVAPGTAALDVGCGVGRWTRRLARRGAQVVGIDHAPAMLDAARRSAARERLADRCRFDVGDAADLDLGRRFDLIVCVTVLQHILDPARVQRAVDRMAAHLAPGGRIVLLEAAPSARTTRCDSRTFVARREEDYRAIFTRAGLRCASVSGVDPLPLKTWLLPYYGSLPRPLAHALLLAVTIVTLPFDVLAARWLCRASWHKAFVLTRAEAA
jgi:SAM-dependent methyltransferase